jgi:MFS transporter, PAT family, beta-lactamase induction signal transducer AmpG
MKSMKNANEVTQSLAKKSWSESIALYGKPYVLKMFLLGFSSGLPFLLIFGTLSFWLREAGIGLGTIGLVSGVGLMYAFKWVWSPLVDRLPLPFLTKIFGIRRSWLLFSQILIMCGLILMATNDPHHSIEVTVFAALLTAFGAATQDVALDAFRIESACPDEQASMVATYMAGYRIAMLWAGAGALWLAAMFDGPSTAVSNTYFLSSWRYTYYVMAGSMLIGVLTTLSSSEPWPKEKKSSKNLMQWVVSAFVEPFVDFVRRYRWRIIVILLLVSTYLTDVTQSHLIIL